MTSVAVVALAVVAILLSAIELARSRWQSLIAWAVLVLAVAVIVPRLV